MNLNEVNFRDVYKNWRRNLKEFRPFVRSTPFVSLQTYDNFNLNECQICNSRNDDLLESVLTSILDKRKKENFIIVDLKLSDILDLAFILNNEYEICPILNVNLLFHPFGIVGSRIEIKKLIYYGLNLNKINSDINVMLIPYNRYDDDCDMKGRVDKLNNQYGVTEEDFPDIDSLKYMGYKKVVLITNKKVKEDVEAYIKYLSNEIKIERVEV